MPEETEGAGVAVAFPVPLIADTVLGPRLVYGTLPIRPLDEEFPLDALLFPMEDDSIGRVTFEGLDAIRGTRGEFLPYERRDVPFSRGEWVYIIEGSGWLEERHRYEFGLYDTPLLERYDHYLFSFHDEFVEAIALGIWFDKPDAAKLLGRPTDHPLLELPAAATAERATLFGLQWELRTNPTPIEQLLEASVLCSQRILQYNLILDGANREHASVWLRTRRGRTVSSFVTGFLGRGRHTAEGVADQATFSEEWRSCVEAVSDRRREMGLD